jgi:ketosteroid isomerase-like protein
MNFGCQKGEEPPEEAVKNVMADIDVLQNGIEKFDELNKAGDAEGIVSLTYAEDSVRMPPNEPMRVGKAIWHS